MNESTIAAWADELEKIAGAARLRRVERLIELGKGKGNPKLRGLYSKLMAKQESRVRRGGSWT
jgi:hypothetical protein